MTDEDARGVDRVTLNEPPRTSWKRKYRSDRVKSETGNTRAVIHPGAASAGFFNAARRSRREHGNPPPLSVSDISELTRQNRNYIIRAIWSRHCRGSFAGIQQRKFEE
ncbi:MAG: hypothetical protein DMF61_10810 [Blastocatellia bacterium AA13]|nr:MAG: hypothetical protein DMF61_10810 [Blastocatellia bacterium AA13]